MSRTDTLAWLCSVSAHLLVGAALFSYQSAQVTVVRGRAPGALPTPSSPIDTRLTDEPKEETDSTLPPVHVRAAAVVAVNEPLSASVPLDADPLPLPRAAQPPGRLLASRPTAVGAPPDPRRQTPPSVPEPLSLGPHRPTEHIAAPPPEAPDEPHESPENPRRTEQRDRAADDPAEASAPAQPDSGQPTPRRDAVPSNQPPAYEHNPPPPYPPEAVRRRLQGRVLLEVHVRADGTVERVALAQSSGHPILDRAAAEAVRHWRFQPARRFGAPIPAVVRVPVRFRLEE